MSWKCGNHRTFILLSFWPTLQVKVSKFMRICPKYKYDPRESTIYLAIWPFSDLKKSFDKVLGNLENLYLRNAIKINYGVGLGRFEVWSSKLDNIEKSFIFL